HTGMMFLLRELHPEFRALKNVPTSFTIHNVAIQGSRPIRGNHDSVEQWFPELFQRDSWISDWKDPRYEEPVLTPMADGICWADKVNTVSPTYSEEILRASEKATGFIGGEGLETLLRRAKSEHRLYGILNGCEYPEERKRRRMPFPEMCDLLESEAAAWNGQT